MYILRKILQRLLRLIQISTILIFSLALVFTIIAFFYPQNVYPLIQNIDIYLTSQFNKSKFEVPLEKVVSGESRTITPFNRGRNDMQIVTIDTIMPAAPNKTGYTYKLYNHFKFQDIHAYLIIDTINVKGPIISGKDEHLMEQGFWHVNINGAWLEGGNIVIFGHRFYHVPPAQDTFFNLDKVQIGDVIQIKTDLGVWQYKVIKKGIISRYDTSIFENREKPTITLVTCHPLWTSKSRLFVLGELQTSLILQ